MKRILFIFSIVCFLSSCSGCGGPSATRTDTHRSGFAEFAADDCFKNIIDENITVFEALNPQAHLLANYVSETEAINMILKDSVRLIIATRDMTEQEREFISEQGETTNPRSQLIAMDAIALIVHPTNPDTLISIPDFKRVMTGEITNWKELFPSSKLGDMKVVFDNPGSSTVRYIKDSICRGEPISSAIFGAKNNMEVLDYVARTPAALGIIGVNWISNPYDSVQLSFNGTVQVMAVSKEEPATIDNSYLPYPALIALGDYPMQRNVYLWLTDIKGTLPAGFADFMGRDRAQRIILKSGLVPATPHMRTIEIKESF